MNTLSSNFFGRRSAIKLAIALAACSGVLLPVEQSFAAAPRPIAAVCAKSLTVEANNRTLQRTPGDVLALMCRAAAYLSVGAPNKALPDLEQLARREPAQPHTQLLLGRAHMAQNNPNQAITAYEQAIALNSEWPEAYLALATAQAKVGKTSEAAHNLNLARLYWDDPLQRAALGKAAQDLNANKLLPEFAIPDSRMLDVLNTTIKVSPANLEARLTRARILLAKGETKKALADFSAAIRANPRNAELYVQRGRAYVQTNNAKRANADFAKAIALAPQSAAGYSARATLQAQQGDLDADRKSVV